MTRCAAHLPLNADVRHVGFFQRLRFPLHRCRLRAPRPLPWAPATGSPPLRCQPVRPACVLSVSLSATSRRTRRLSTGSKQSGSGLPPSSSRLGGGTGGLRRTSRRAGVLVDAGGQTNVRVAHEFHFYSAKWLRYVARARCGGSRRCGPAMFRTYGADCGGQWLATKRRFNLLLRTASRQGFRITNEPVAL